MHISLLYLEVSKNTSLNFLNVFVRILVSLLDWKIPVDFFLYLHPYIESWQARGSVSKGKYVLKNKQNVEQFKKMCGINTLEQTIVRYMYLCQLSRPASDTQRLNYIFPGYNVNNPVDNLSHSLDTCIVLNSLFHRSHPDNL